MSCQKHSFDWIYCDKNIIGNKYYFFIFAAEKTMEVVNYE